MGINAGTARSCSAVARLLLLKLEYFVVNSKLNEDWTSWLSPWRQQNGTNSRDSTMLSIESPNSFMHKLLPEAWSQTKHMLWRYHEIQNKGYACGNSYTFHQFHEGRGCRCPQGFEANGAFCGAVLAYAGGANDLLRLLTSCPPPELWVVAIGPYPVSA